MNGVGLSAHSRLYCVILVQSTFSETLLVYAYIGTKVFDFCQLVPYCDSGLLISNIDVDIIDDTFDVSISTILSYKSIDRGIDDTLLAFFYRHYIDTSQLICKMMHITF